MNKKFLQIALFAALTTTHANGVVVEYVPGIQNCENEHSKCSTGCVGYFPPNSEALENCIWACGATNSVCKECYDDCENEHSKCTPGCGTSFPPNSEAYDNCIWACGATKSVCQEKCPGQ